MGILDKVFGGKKGIVNLLACQFGGTIRLIYVVGVEYNETTGKETHYETSVVLPFLPSEENVSVAQSQVPGNDASGLIDSNEQINGSVPAANVLREPQALRDKMEYNGTIYLIQSVRKVFLGNTLTDYYLTGIRV